MTDDLLDDVKALLEKDFGDDRILKQIHRACENGEVISNFERNYVRKLAEKHLGKKPEVPPPVEKEVVPDVILPESATASPKTSTIVSVSAQHATQQTVRKKPRAKRGSSKNKMMIGIGVIALVVIVGAGVGLGGNFSMTSDLTPGSVTAPEATTESFMIKTDTDAYSHKDIISISGVSDVGDMVDVSIMNPEGQMVWAEELSLKNDGRYATLAIAAGSGWDSSGTYTITVDNGEKTKSGTFSFDV